MAHYMLNMTRKNMSDMQQIHAIWLQICAYGNTTQTSQSTLGLSELLPNLYHFQGPHPPACHV